ncbi:hypothetical protein SERLADRAFT_457435 [Serpula lacrymans var. lacrymans S7.9]|uniref:Uncharacterized protein n=1 Tax=Serpula lacrymans var. lacrymans (strain S7.9) TaxID=578457 RepID=F8NJ64_SERL9|nr:uncharacterized protein SERLADRAFT_457435 [Serpula lacrymans var. lacrymans S7.9]EGO29548.1 hypothetical protein SERLADRAFT_457435 [Serpula lacrymans var. lacrymans S7.9]
MSGIASLSHSSSSLDGVLVITTDFLRNCSDGRWRDCTNDGGIRVPVLLVDRLEILKADDDLIFGDIVVAVDSFKL